MLIHLHNGGYAVKIQRVVWRVWRLMNARFGFQGTYSKPLSDTEYCCRCRDKQESRHNISFSLSGLKKLRDIRLLLIAVLLLACTGAALAQGGPCYVHTGPWTKVWDFDSGLQGWTLYVNAFMPSSPVGGKQGTIWAGDNSYAQYDTNSDPILRQRLSGAGGRFFVLQCDVYIGANNYLQGNGLSVRRASDGKGPWAIGSQASSQGIAGNDKSWYNTLKSRSWGLSQPNWVTLQIDYGYSKPGYFTVGYKVTPGNPAGWPADSWAWAIDYTHANDPNNPSVVHPTEVFRYIRIGGSVTGSPWSGWAQAYYGAVRIFVPEPAGILAFGVGLAGLGGGLFRRRNKFVEASSQALSMPDF